LQLKLQDGAHHTFFPHHRPKKKVFLGRGHVEEGDGRRRSPATPGAGTTRRRRPLTPAISSQHTDTSFPCSYPTAICPGRPALLEDELARETTGGARERRCARGSLSRTADGERCRSLCFNLLSGKRGDTGLGKKEFGIQYL
jgi:hypothetical protein